MLRPQRKLRTNSIMIYRSLNIVYIVHKFTRIRNTNFQQSDCAQSDSNLNVRFFGFLKNRITIEAQK